MSRLVRMMILFAVLLSTPVVIGCGSKADSTPNPELGPPPDIPAGREAGDGPGDGPADPMAPKRPK